MTTKENTTPVTVLLPGALREVAGGRSRVDVEAGEGTTLGAVLDVLAARYPLLGRRLRDERHQLRRHVNFYVSGEECRRLDGAATPVTPGTEIHIIPSVAGG
ncbi:ubiquitin-like small modifier protein 1 [Sphaerisporangium sp. B11E5]|uniref:ubiquitin-like small modifier protein 1 n=1 Tax=Sphaerisporangium sp. B11E5 TaxID=3153563 RepID=UPI00325EDCD9